MFFCKFCNILKNNSFVKHIGTAAAKKISDTIIWKLLEKIINRLSLHWNQRRPRRIRMWNTINLEWLEKWVLCVLLQQNISIRLSSLLHSVHEILRKLRIFPKENWCQEKIPRKKNPPWEVRDSVRLGIGLGLSSGGFFRGRFFRRTKKIT